jgi:acetyl esterase/lipase
MEPLTRNGARRQLLIAAGAGLLASLPPPDAAAAGVPAPPPPGPRETCKVRVSHDILYHATPGDPDRRRHRLDVYRPLGRDGRPVLFFVHGGAWVAGSKDDVLAVYGYGTIADSLARRGVVVVMPNYRLSPAVRHPEHIRDVARAFAWTCANVRNYAGDPSRIFVGGHSAGGHLVSLLATDETYLQAEGRGLRDVRGVIAVSGVYRLDAFGFEKTFGPLAGLTVSLRASPLFPVFGTNPAVLREASPASHVRPGLPPFLLINGSLDYCPLREMAREFGAALREKGCEVRTREVAWRTHETLLFDIPHLDSDATTRAAILEFITNHRGTEDTEKEHTEKTKGKVKGNTVRADPLVSGLLSCLLLSSVCLVSVSSVPLWFVPLLTPGAARRGWPPSR